MKSPGTDDWGLRALEGRGTSLVSMWGPAPRQGALARIAFPGGFTTGCPSRDRLFPVQTFEDLYPLARQPAKGLNSTPQFQ
jgi:hypothetical protein